MSRLVYPDPICIGLIVPTENAPRAGAPSSADPSSDSGISRRLASRLGTSALGAAAVVVSSRLYDAVGVACLVGTAVTDQADSRHLRQSLQQNVVLAQHVFVTSYGPSSSVYCHTLNGFPKTLGLRLRSLEPRPI